MNSIIYYVGSSNSISKGTPSPLTLIIDLCLLLTKNSIYSINGPTYLGVQCIGTMTTLLSIFL